jgi:predicted anti-sigma-YlaC factor YlaD
MEMSGGQLCARARFWASLRVDGELSELEGALLDAHLGRCGECRDVAVGFESSTELLRSAHQERVAPVALDVRRSPRRLLTSVAVAALLLVGVVAGSLVRAEVSTDASSAPRLVAVVASSETPDQLRRLRRTTLLNSRRLPRDISGEPV